MRHILGCILCSVVVFSGPVLGQDSAIPAADGGDLSVEGEVMDTPVGSAGPPVSSSVARKELQSLLDQGLRLLATELVEKGTFYPFVVMLGHDGEIRLIGAPVKLRDGSAESAVEALVAKTRQLAQERRIRAAGFFMDYLATRQDTGFSQPGIRVELNHIHPDSLSVFVPYRVTDDKKLRLLTPQYSPGKNIVFGKRQ